MVTAVWLWGESGTMHQTTNRLLLAGGLCSLTMLALTLRAWLGGTGPDQLDPAALTVSLALAVGLFAPAFRTPRAEDVEG